MEENVVSEAVVCESKQLELHNLVDKHAIDNQGFQSAVKDFYIYKGTQPQKKNTYLYDAGIIIMASGQKRCHLNGRTYEYGVGSYFGLFLPMPIEVEQAHASPEEPILAIALKMDLNKIAEMLLKLDKLETSAIKAPADMSGIFVEPLNDDLLDPVIRLLKLLDKPTDVAMLSPNIVDEIYYRVLTGPHVAAIRGLLEQRGQIQQIARAVDYINLNIDAPVVIDDLADKANMSVSHFHKSFKDVMQMSPLQYAKSMKLFKAQALISEGKKASQAGYLVGYNSPAQFSREYKRQFGFAPSETGSV